MKYGVRWAATLGCLAVAYGCAADGMLGVDGGAAEAGSIDASEPRDAGHDAGSSMDDAAVIPDAGMRPDGAAAGLECTACSENADCMAGFACVELSGGGNVCLRNCVPDLPDCPARFDCVESLIMPLPAPVCAPVGERCCVDADGDDHGLGVGCRGLDCNDGDPATNAGAMELCDGADNDCDGTIDEGEPGAGFVCSTGMTGACASGVTACVDGALVCEPAAASTVEICDGMDNDCDVGIDEDDAGLALTRACYDGPAGTEGVGACAAGVQTCAGGEYRSCVGQVLPGSEVCDGADNDCDGTPDDGDPGGGIACTASAPGVCAAGTTQCTGGSVQCVSTIAPGSQPEICDDLDNDCDGTLNDGFPGLGTACFSGAGICRRAGVTVCDASDPSAPPVCDAVPGAPSASETCDYVDDDCDGQTDEGFRDASGTYDTIAHCGACGFDCAAGWPGGAAGYHVVPACAVSGSSGTCTFTCVSGWVDADGVRENGCELSPEPDTIYVSTPTNGGNDVTGCGAWDAPCETIGYGIERARAAGSARVRVSTGLFRENIELEDGVSVLGGHSHVNWVQNPSVFGTTIRGLDAPSSAGGANDRIVVSAIGITSATELSGFTITGVNAGPGGNSIGVYVRDSDEGLLIRDNDIAAGAGGNGATGAAGAPGSAGSGGADGVGPAWRACGAPRTDGAAGGAQSCGGTSTSGGRGGHATDPTTSDSLLRRSGAGVDGNTGLGGNGGAGGYHMTGYNNSQCIVHDNPIEGGVGMAGAPGSDGSGGNGASDAFGATSTSQWRGSAGGAGFDGTHGGGGGGGGSPGGVYANFGSYCIYSTTGGGGGAGGCRGNGGGAGTAGGGSFAIFVLHTTTPTTMARITGNHLRRGSGGRGGDGGTGGGGGEGGAGGAGGDVGSFADTYDFCLFDGAPGGAGGRGGHGGGGGGGAGGVSYGIWVSRPGGATPSYGGNTFEIGAGVDTGGDGGEGGNSSNTSIGLGGDGVDGASGTIRVGG